MSPEERQVRLKKADSIRKMLADQSTPSASTSGRKHTYIDFWHANSISFYFAENPDEEKKEREHLLALNQMIAQQVLQKRRSFSQVHTQSSSLFISKKYSILYSLCRKLTKNQCHEKKKTLLIFFLLIIILQL